jgi:hypothetical protein
MMFIRMTQIRMMLINITYKNVTNQNDAYQNDTNQNDTQQNGVWGVSNFSALSFCSMSWRQNLNSILKFFVFYSASIP